MLVYMLDSLPRLVERILSRRCCKLTDCQDWIEMHAKDSEPQTFFGQTGHFDLMDSESIEQASCSE